MYLYAKDDFTLQEDLEEVKTGLLWLAESFLPHGTRYAIWYDPNSSRIYGRGIKTLEIRADEEMERLPRFQHAEYNPPLWDVAMGLYRVCTRVAEGKPPALPDTWRARKHARYMTVQALRQAINDVRLGQHTPETYRRKERT